jgi:RNA polymerase sigma-70 factor, ECF subfamily
MNSTTPKEPSVVVTCQPAADFDTKWIDRLRNHDEIAFRELIDEHGNWIRRTVLRLVPSSEAEDVVQQVLLTVWRKIHLFRGESSFKTWLFQITIRQTRNHRRSWARWLNRIERLWDRQSQIRDTSDRADSRWESLDQALQQLTYRDRELLVLIYLEGYSMRELTQLFPETTNALEVRLHRAKKRLRKLIDLQEGRT